MSKDFEQYKIVVEEHRFITDLSWKIFAIASTILFVTPFVLSNLDFMGTKKIELRIVGVFGLILTFCIFAILFNYRRREETLENWIVGAEKDLKLKMQPLSEIRERRDKEKYFKFLPDFMPLTELHKNRFFMGLIFFLLVTLYSLIIIWQLL